jgi:hypothetical protein
LHRRIIASEYYSSDKTCRVERCRACHYEIKCSRFRICFDFILSESSFRILRLTAVHFVRVGEAHVLTFVMAVEDALKRYPNNGRFSLLCGESINDVVKRENIPAARGVYIIFRCDDADRPLYIGKAGTVNQDGAWKEQGLAERLTMKQDGKYRREYFGELMSEQSIAGLTVQWFVTHDQINKVIPALAEMELLQAHFDQYDCLPKLNRCA